jgi:hypothetical protein
LARLDEWREMERHHGPARSLRLALKLPDLARSVDAEARRQAAWAVGSSLFWNGNFQAARRWLEPIGTPELSWTLALLGECDTTLSQPQDPLLDFFLDQPQGCLRHLAACRALVVDSESWPRRAHFLSDSLPHGCSMGREAGEIGAVAVGLQPTIPKPDRLLGQPIEIVPPPLLHYWAYSRLSLPTDEAATQAALAAARAGAPSTEAIAVAIYACARFQQHPVHALPHLDQALVLCARLGLHFLDARLFERKAHGLDASGLLRDASRFQRLAEEARRRASNSTPKDVLAAYSN